MVLLLPVPEIPGTLPSKTTIVVLADNPTIGYLAARTNVQYEG